MSQFDELDARTAAAVGRVFEDLVIWQPRLTVGGFIAPTRPDPNRPVRELPAIITWAPSGLPVAAQPGGGMVNTTTLMIDFERVLFQEQPWAQYGEPKKGDWIEMPTEKILANRLIEIDSIGDDGSSRFLCWCNVVTPQ